MTHTGFYFRALYLHLNGSFLRRFRPRCDWEAYSVLSLYPPLNPKLTEMLQFHEHKQDKLSFFVSFLQNINTSQLISPRWDADGRNNSNHRTLITTKNQQINPKLKLLKMFFLPMYNYIAMLNMRSNLLLYPTIFMVFVNGSPAMSCLFNDKKFM